MVTGPDSVVVMSLAGQTPDTNSCLWEPNHMQSKSTVLKCQRLRICRVLGSSQESPVVWLRRQHFQELLNYLISKETDNPYCQQLKKKKKVTIGLERWLSS